MDIDMEENENNNNNTDKEKKEESNTNSIIFHNDEDDQHDDHEINSDAMLIDSIDSNDELEEPEEEPEEEETNNTYINDYEEMEGYGGDNNNRRYKVQVTEIIINENDNNIFPNKKNKRIEYTIREGGSGSLSVPSLQDLLAL